MTAAFLLLVFLIFLLMAANVCTGSVGMSFSEAVKILIHREGSQTLVNIIWEIRMPRAMAAVLLGGALSVSGFLLQTFFHNPIAGPFVLGISSGAKLAVALVMVFLISKGVQAGAAELILAAFAGAMISMGAVLALSLKVDRMAMLVVAGVMIGYICSAATDFIVTFADDSSIVNLHNWSLGSFSGITWADIKVIAALVLPAMLAVFLLSKPIGAFQLGETCAANLGVNVRALRFALIVLSSVLSAVVTACAGPISFVGIAVPHLARVLLKTSKPILLIPACFLGGAVFCLGCDLIARNLFAPAELSISSVTAVFGAPVVLFLMIRRREG